MNGSYIDCEVVMLPTSETTNLHKCKLTGELSHTSLRNGEYTGDFHLYLTSQQEINEGDWCIFTDTHNGEIMKYNAPKQALYKYAQGIYNLKVIASTNPLLHLPSIPKSFLEAYVKANGKIKSTKLEIESTKIKGIGIPFNKRYKLKLTSDNEVVILDESKGV